jgi:hypothetical protein
VETLERDLLLTWIAVEREDSQRLAAFNAAAQRDWTVIVRNYGDVSMRPDLRYAAVRVGLWMPTLDYAASGGDFYRANMVINLVQNELRVLRPQYGLDHPADRLYDFYFQWQDVVAASNDPTMCLLEWNEYEERVELAAKTWREYLAARPRFSDYLFPGYGHNAQASEVAGLTMTESLNYFETLLEQADHTLAAEPSRMIDDLFFDYLAVVTAYPTDGPTVEPMR